MSTEDLAISLVLGEDFELTAPKWFTKLVPNVLQVCQEPKQIFVPAHDLILQLPLLLDVCHWCAIITSPEMDLGPTGECFIVACIILERISMVSISGPVKVNSTNSIQSSW